MGIEVLVPDVNRSAGRVRAGPQHGRGRHGTSRRSSSAWPRCATSARAWWSGSWPSARPTGPSPTSTTSAPRVDPVVLNKRTMESLVKAGAFDSLGHPRQGLCLVLEDDRRPHARAPAGAGPRHRHALRRLRGGGGGRPRAGAGAKVAIPDTEFDKAQRLAFEKEMLGLYVSDHPLMGFEAALARHTDCTLVGHAGGRTRPAAGPLAGAGGGRGGHRPAALVHEEGRPHGPVRPRRPAGGDGGLRLPEDDGRVRRAARERRHRGRPGPARHPRRGAEDRVHGGHAGPMLERGQEDLHITLPLGC